MAGEWEPVAQNWVRWARSEGHDAYWYYRDAFFDQIVPTPGRRTLEVGCGEGRVVRDLEERGHQVVGVDSSPTLLRYARLADPAGVYMLAEAAALPFAAGSFDLVVAYNSLQDVADMPGSLREIVRVLAPGGRLCVCVVHPFTDMGRLNGDVSHGPSAIPPSYFGVQRVNSTVERNGLKMTFRGWSYPLEDYASALESAGLQIERLREPRPTAPPPWYEPWQHMPMFLNMRAVRR